MKMMSAMTNHDRPINCLSDPLLHVLSSFLPHFLLLLPLSLSPYATAQPHPNQPLPLPPPPDPYKVNDKISASVAIILVAAILAFISMGFLAVYLLQYTDRLLRQPVRGIGGAPSGSERWFRPVRLGLDPETIANFPTFPYSTVRRLRVRAEPLECAVCVTEFGDDETLRLIPKCDHAFHPQCIDVWLASHTTCPVCRACLVPEPGELARVTLPIPDSDVTNSGSVSGAENARNRLLGQGSAFDVVAANQKRAARSRSVTERITGIFFRRSHTTGHSPVIIERFTLGLPEGVRDEIVNSTVGRTMSCVAFRRERSTRKGFRNDDVWSGGKIYFHHERLDRDQESGSVRSWSPKVATEDEPMMNLEENACERSIFRSLV